ncbi:MAG: aspartate-semialdehyde dehydrogenase [Chlamydiales bacterium]|nr:aspartate-semialdehyde dehydrogenase [Chlamydiales bacterium]
MHIAIIGASGLVGREIHNQLIKRNFVFSKISLFGRVARDEILSLDSIHWHDIDLAFFAAGSSVSKKYIPQALAAGCRVIDSSSYYRNSAPLIIPEINGHLIKDAQLIASPNCTASIALMALYPLHVHCPIQRIVASTYQAASGGGHKMMQAFLDNPLEFPLHLHDSFDGHDYSGEERKMSDEMRLILNAPGLPISARCVRVPVLRAHSIALNVEFEKPIADPKTLLQSAPGLRLVERPTPKDATECDDVFCGSIRQDPSHPNCLELWVVGDQLLKGAALNAVQIAEQFSVEKKVQKILA